MQKRSPEKSSVKKLSVTIRPAKNQSINLTPSRDEIARRAYEIYVARGKTCGRELEDWVQAERELSGREMQNN